MSAATRACPGCGTANPPRARFCMSCGQPIAACTQCGAELPPEARFCVECGAPRADTGPQASAPAPTPSAPDSAPAAALEALPDERRVASILFADLSGYTSIAEGMDPEAVKSLVNHCLGRLAQEVERYGGRIDKFIGDNVMAVFGAPVAHEDDPERAVRSGLAMLDAMREINEQVAAEHGVELALRVGINTGEVLAGSIGDGYTVIGDAVNVASRLEAASEPGTVTVGEPTWRATREGFEFAELAPLELKGKSTPVQAWRVLGALAPAHVVREVSESTPIVGRVRETEALIGLYETAVNESRPHLVTIVGPAGVGKSRLARELHRAVADRAEGPAVRVGRSLPYGAGTSYWALAEILRGEFEIVDTDDNATAWSKLENGLEEVGGEEGWGQDVGAIATLLARPLGIEPPGAESEDDEDDERRRERMFAAVRSLLTLIAKRRPVVLLVEDIHWADEGMLDLIEYLTRSVPATLLIVALTREDLLERRPGFGAAQANATMMRLAPLTDVEARELVEALLPIEGRGEAGELLDRLADRSGGNPLFAEEMVKRLVEEGSDLAEIELPESVHAVLAARLDSLEPAERRVIQHAAVVGETFWEGSIEGASSSVDDSLAELQAKGLIVPSPGTRLAGEQEYAFKHALIRDVAYSQLPKHVRASLHAQVGRFIERRAGDRSEAVIALMAEHFGRAAALGAEAKLEAAELGPIEADALRYLEAAGDAAALLFSNVEALAHFRDAMSLSGAGDPDVRARLAEKRGDVALRIGRADEAIELWEECIEHHRHAENLLRIGDLHRKIGSALLSRGERDATIEHYQRGIDLLKDGPPAVELVRLYEEAATLYMNTGDNMLAVYAAEKALRLAERLDESAAASRAHGIFGRVFGRIGDVEKARENLERSVRLARDGHRFDAIRALLALGQHLEGSEADYPAAGSAYADALAISEEVGEAAMTVELRAALARLALHRGDWTQTERNAERSLELAEREHLTGSLCYPLVIRGILEWRHGDFQRAAATCERAAELGQQAGRSEATYSALIRLAAVHRDLGDYALAETQLNQALDTCERAGLVAQSIETQAARAVTLALGGQAERAREAAEEAAALAERLPSPVGGAAAREAAGATLSDADRGIAELTQARDDWRRLGRPLDAAWVRLLLGWRQAQAEREEASETLAQAAEELDRAGVPHLAERARSLTAARLP